MLLRPWSRLRSSYRLRHSILWSGGRPHGPEAPAWIPRVLPCPSRSFLLHRMLCPQRSTTVVYRFNSFPPIDSWIPPFYLLPSASWYLFPLSSSLTQPSIDSPSPEAYPQLLALPAELSQSSNNTSEVVAQTARPHNIAQIPTPSSPLKQIRNPLADPLPPNAGIALLRLGRFPAGCIHLSLPRTLLIWVLPVGCRISTFKLKFSSSSMQQSCC